MDWYTTEILKSEWSMYAATPSASPADRQRAKQIQDLIILGQIRNILMTLEHFGKPLPFIRRALATVKELGLLNCDAANTTGLKLSQLTETRNSGELARLLAGYMSISPATSEGVIEMILAGWEQPVREGTLLGLFGARGEALEVGEDGLIPWGQTLAVIENFTPLADGFPYTRYASPTEYQLLRQEVYMAHTYNLKVTPGNPVVNPEDPKAREAFLKTARPDAGRLRSRLILQRGSRQLMATNLGHRDNVFVVKTVS